MVRILVMTTLLQLLPPLFGTPSRNDDAVYCFGNAFERRLRMTEKLP